MIETEPQTFLICRPSIDWDAVAAYLKEVDGDEWFYRQIGDGAHYPSKAQGAAQMLVEFAGRLCYRSWKPGLNKNVTKVRTDQAEYFKNLLEQAHGSVLEHANYTFVFHNVSRVFTHEICRHRVGVAISQESLRYVRLTELGFRVPPALEAVRDRVVGLVRDLEHWQQDVAGELDLDNKPFSEKKIITSALRRLAPIGLSTGIVWTANVRTLRATLAARTAPGAEEEIRIVFNRVGEIMMKEAPLLFQDFEPQPLPGGGPPVWIPSNPVAGSVRVG